MARIPGPVSSGRLPGSASGELKAVTSYLNVSSIFRGSLYFFLA
jgi:hypothetical protein